MQAIAAVAFKELRDGLRNRWVLAITLVFAVLAMSLSYFGAAASGVLGFAGLATTIVSLASLAVFLIPLIALFLAYDSIVGEEEQGTLLLLLTYPLSRTQLLIGKFLGHGAILAVATTLGFGVAGAIIALYSESLASAELWPALGLFILSATLLGWSFVALAYVSSAVVSEKSKAAGLALVIWFALVLLFDMVLLGFLVASGGGIGAGVLPYLLLLNPTDIFRLINLTGFETVREQASLLSIAEGELFNPGFLLIALVAWVAAPFALAVWLFKRRDA